MSLSTVQATTTGLAPSDALVVLVTMETLGLAALSIGAVMAVPITGAGWGISRGTVAVLAFCATAVLAVLGAAAGLAWSELYLHPWPDDLTSRLVAIGILVGFAAQPFFGLVIALGVKE
jgi:hypothetical protein